MPSADKPHTERSSKQSNDDMPFGLSFDPDAFHEQELRREKIIKMRDAVRPGRTIPVAIRFDQFTLHRLKTLATLYNTGYQTLLKEFVAERLYEEEKRAGIIES